MRGVESLEESRLASRSPAGRELAARGAGGAGRRGLRRCGGSPARGVTGGGGGGAALAAATRPRSSQTTPARGRARTVRTHSPNNARWRPAERLAARRPTARPGERGPEVSPRRFLQIRPLFVWQTWLQRGALEERRGRPAGDPLSASPGVTGGQLGGGRWRVGTACARGCDWGEAPILVDTLAGGVFFDSFENRALENRETFFGVPGGETDSSADLVGPGALFGARLKRFGIASLETSFPPPRIVKGAERERPPGCPDQEPGVVTTSYVAPG